MTKIDQRAELGIAKRLSFGKTVVMTDTPEGRAPAKSARIPVDSFAHRLMLARAHAGHLSIRESAELTGLGRGAWTHWEKGGMPVDMEYVVEVISEKLGVDPVWLLHGGALAEPETRSRRQRWSTVRPAHAPKPSQTTGPKLRPAKVPSPGPERTTVDRPPNNRPSGRPARSAPSPHTRRPVRL